MNHVYGLGLYARNPVFMCCLSLENVVFICALLEVIWQLFGLGFKGAVAQRAPAPAWFRWRAGVDSAEKYGKNSKKCFPALLPIPKLGPIQMGCILGHVWALATGKVC